MTLVDDLRLDTGDDDGVFPSGGSVSQHTLLSSTAHSDTITATASNGALIAGSGSFWTSLPSGAEGNYLGVENGSLGYSIPALNGDLDGNITAATVTGIQNREVSTTAPTDGQVLKWNSSSSLWEPANDETASGSGIFGPTPSTDNAVPRFDGVAGNILQDSPVLIDDNGNITIPSGIQVGGTLLPTGTTWIAVSRENYVTVTQTSGVLVALNASPVNWEKHIVKDGAGVADISPIVINGSGNTIDGAPTLSMGNRYGAVTLIFNGSEWSVV